LVEKNEEVSPARNHNAHCRCATHHPDFHLDDPVVQPLFQCHRVNKFCRRTHNRNISSRIRGNYHICSRRLARWILALEGGHENMLREEEHYASYVTVVAHSDSFRHYPISENYAGTLKTLLFTSDYRQSDFALPDGKVVFKFELSQASQLLLLSSTMLPKVYL
jgi:hypothetical protein